MAKQKGAVEMHDYMLGYFGSVYVNVKAKSFEEAKEIADKFIGSYKDVGIFDDIYVSEIDFITDENGNDLL